MQIAVLGTGTVGQVLAGALEGLGHDVAVGTRDPAATLARSGADGAGYSAWQAAHPGVALRSFAAAAADAEVVVNATSGVASLAALEACGDLAGKVLLDVANALDFTAGFPPSLAVVNTDSLAEQLQRAFPALRVVKALNTMNCQVMVEPSRLPAPHNVFVAGDDAAAKATVTGLLRELGWPQDRILDLGGLQAARGAEMFLPLWLSTMQALGTADFNIAIVKA